MNGRLTLTTVEAGLEFEARFASSSMRFDSGPHERAANPVESLLASLAACMGMDVIEILRKKRLDVTGYHVEMTGERAADHPRRFTTITLTHVVTGRGISPQAVAEAVRLSSEKYCSVRHSLAKDLAIEDRIEVRTAI